MQTPLLGIDYGDKKLGLALADPLPQPLSVFRYSSFPEIVSYLRTYFSSQPVTGIVIGISEGESAEKARAFGNALYEAFSLPIAYVDETLTTHDAQVYALAAGKSRKSRREMEDAYAAAIILERYLS
jgi:putative Holliday junction resolvase